MKKLENDIRRLSKKIYPSREFCKDAKLRLMHHVELTTQEAWFIALLRKIGKVMPSPDFVQLARMRLMYRIAQTRESMLSWLLIGKRVLASTLVMVLAVTATLFFVDGHKYVSAAEDTYLQVLSGEVTVKHANQLAWDVIPSRVDLSAGDLVRLSYEAEAVVHFFDDSQMRLSENSLILLNQLNVSQGYAKQGVIEVFLHEGQAWVQTLNVDDGFAGFSVITPDAIISGQHTSFDVSAKFNQPTILRVLKYNVAVDAIQKGTNEIVATERINANQKLVLEGPSGTQPTEELIQLDKFADIIELSEADYKDEWVTKNFERDQNHLAFVRERELNTLRQAAGVLPGQMLYPIKLAKERLKLTFSFGQEQLTRNQIAIANQRLQEAIVLLEQGETQKAKAALMAYQSTARIIAEQARDNELVRSQISSDILATHEKALVAALPGDAQIRMIKNALSQTRELMASDVIERGQVRLANDQERLLLIQDLVTSGNIKAAKELLVSYELSSASLFNMVERLTDEEQKRVLLSTILEARNEELRLIEGIGEIISTQKVSDFQFVALLEAANKSTKQAIENTVALIQPLEPDIILQPVALSSIDKKVNYFVEKIYIYKSWTGQKNQIIRLMKLNPLHARDMNFLTKLRGRLDGRAREYINVKILQLSREKKIQKDREIRRKIEQSKRLRIF